MTAHKKTRSEMIPFLPLNILSADKKRTQKCRVTAPGKYYSGLNTELILIFPAEQFPDGNQDLSLYDSHRYRSDP